MRKFLGLFLIIVIGIPVLFAITWAAGLTRAVVSPKFLGEVPQKIIAAVPDISDEILAAGRDRDVVDDPRTRAWFEAAGKVAVKPRDLLAKTGILAWMQGELTRALGEVSDILRGRREVHSVWIDLRPLKTALLNPAIDAYLLDVLNNLPPCDQAGLAEWSRAGEVGWSRAHLPPCRPDMKEAEAALKTRQDRVVRDIDDEIQIFENVRIPRIGILRSVTLASIFMFLIPAVFILGGSAIATRTREQFLKWSGVSVIVGGLIALGGAWMVRNSVAWAMKWAPWSHGRGWSVGLGPLVLEKTRWAASLVLENLFNPVMSVAGAVCAVGLILFAFSFLARPRT